MTLCYRPATPQDAPECLRLRGLTRENPVSVQRLAELGITAQSWAADTASGDLPGFVALEGGAIVAYCFGAARTGEVVVLVVMPAHEGRGVGRHLLGLVGALLRQLGHTRLFLGCSPDPRDRSHGFYRHLGWRSTGEVDRYGDEVLELLPAEG
ncbi:GNAT family N-acetyltransferase [Roseateles sp. BYS180W]|uniref:GNAT family N-acetyltransferase n=1 Tax=Roseateles rivi TaxID=3299028 RepID=A0ABW7FT46_9BURK